MTGQAREYAYELLLTNWTQLMARSTKRLRGSDSFANWRFHALLTLSAKFYFNFPSRYLFAIGVVAVLRSLTSSLPRT